LNKFRKGPAVSKNFITVLGITGEEGVMHDMWTRVVTQLLARVGGPMKFRLVLQPLMASFFAIRAGLEDAKANKPPYFWSLLSEPGQRAEMIKEGWSKIGRVFILAFLLDVVYQIIVLRFVYVGEAVIVSFVLAIVPFLILRGLVTRLARLKNAVSTHPVDAPILRR
jgi:hypothetical protein